MTESDTIAAAWLADHADDLIELRRDLHAHPEVSYDEKRTTDVIERYLAALGLTPRVLPSGTGVICDVGTGGPIVGLRADIDALPLADLKDAPYRSTVDGVSHACGHDAHTAILLAVASILTRIELPGTVRLLFQPAEEQVPGGALEVIEAGGLDGLSSVFALHCDPHLDTGRIGVRVGAITAACDSMELVLTGPGGHTGRPHLTVDLVHALGTVITQLPAALSRRVDARAALSVVWGAVEAGRAMNAIPMTGSLRGTIRMLDRDTWHWAEPLIRELVAQIVAPSGAQFDIDYVQGVPPAVNDAGGVDLQRAAGHRTLGPDAVVTTQQSMGGEDFAWFLEAVPGALARLGVRKPGSKRSLDLHQGTFDIDEDALAIGVRFSVALALEALAAA